MQESNNSKMTRDLDGHIRLANGMFDDEDDIIVVLYKTCICMEGK